MFAVELFSTKRPRSLRRVTKHHDHHSQRQGEGVEFGPFCFGDTSSQLKKVAVLPMWASSLLSSDVGCPLCNVSALSLQRNNDAAFCNKMYVDRTVRGKETICNVFETSINLQTKMRYSQLQSHIMTRAWSIKNWAGAPSSLKTIKQLASMVTSFVVVEMIGPRSAIPKNTRRRSLLWSLCRLYVFLHHGNCVILDLGDRLDPKSSCYPSGGTNGERTRIRNIKQYDVQSHRRTRQVLW